MLSGYNREEEIKLEREVARDRELIIAIAEKKGLEQVEQLLKAGANPNTKHDKPALHMAVEANDVDYVKLVLNYRAEIEQTYNNYWQDTPLIVAAQIGNDAIVKELLDKNANINAVNNFGVSALHKAAEWRKMSTVELLLKHKALVDLQNKDGYTPLSQTVASILAETYGKNPTINELSEAQLQNMVIAKKLIDHDADVNQISKKHIHTNVAKHLNLYAMDHKIKTLWDSNNNLKENIIKLFETDIGINKTAIKSTGFFDPKFEKKQETYVELKNAILEIVKQEKIDLKNFYKYMLGIQNPPPSEFVPKEIHHKISYIIEKIEEEKPSFKDKKEKWSDEVTIGLNF